MLELVTRRATRSGARRSRGRSGAAVAAGLLLAALAVGCSQSGDDAPSDAGAASSDALCQALASPDGPLPQGDGSMVHSILLFT